MPTKIIVASFDNPNAAFGAMHDNLFIPNTRDAGRSWGLQGGAHLPHPTITQAHFQGTRSGEACGAN